jgi:hypothetical protein
MPPNSSLEATVIFLLAALSACWPAPAHALTCAGGTDRYFVHCSATGCTVAFSVREIPARGPNCARRALVDSPTSDAAAVILHRARSELISPGVYEVTLVHKKLFDQPVSAAELIRAFDAGALSGPEMSVHRMADDISAVQDLRRHWESRSRRSLLDHQELVDVLLFAAALLAILWSAALFRKRPPPG